MNSFHDPSCLLTAFVTITVTRPLAPTITAPPSAFPGQKGLTASVPLREASSYDWTILSGTITTGQGSNAVTFTAGSGPVVVDGVEVGVRLSVVETHGECESEKASASLFLRGSGDATERRKPHTVPFR
jgi:PKD-like domain